MAHMRYVLPALTWSHISVPPPLVGMHSDGQVDSYSFTNWAGYSVESRNNSGASFTDVQAYWTQPAVAAHTYVQNTVFWVGLGGACVDGAGCSAIWQGGTYGNNDGSGIVRYYPWYENYGCSPNPGCPYYITTISNLPLNPNEQVYGHTYYTGSTGDFAYTNLTQHKSTNIVVSNLTTTGINTSAEAIAEQASYSSCNNNPCHYPGFGNAAFNNIGVNGQYNHLCAMGYTQENMVYNGVPEATTGAMNCTATGGNAYGFNVSSSNSRAL